MNENIIAEAILYGVWLLMPAIVFVILGLGQVSRPLRIKSTLATAIFVLPAYLGLPCLLTGMVWPPDIFFRGSYSRVSVSVSDYRIDYAQEWGLDFYETYYEVTRQDGLKAYLEIDGDANKCWRITTQQVGTKIYFLCEEKVITEKTSYVDTEQKLLYVGWLGCSRQFDELIFREYRSNPLVSRPESGNPELYCE